MHDRTAGAIQRTWKHFPLRSEHTWLNAMLLAIPVAYISELAWHSPLVTFIAAAVAIVPLAGVLGEATDHLAGRLGPTLGGLLNATMGNATELIIAAFALRLGHVQVVKASLSGSIIGNLLLVLGLSVIVGGAKREKQTFSRTAVGANTTMLFIAVVALIMPAVYDLTIYGNLRQHNPRLEELSLATSAVLVFIYLVSFLFMLKTHKSLFHHGAEEERKTSAVRPLISLITATILIGFLSELLVSRIGAVTQSIGMTETFVGIIVVAIIGNAAEHSTAIMVARRNHMDLAMTIAVGSSTQIALFVAPVLVFLSFAFGHPMSLIFSGLEIAAIVLSVLIVVMISSDGETNWFEGAQLVAVYLIIAIAFYFLPG